MPIYEYECQKCGKITEALQDFNDSPLKRCKSCGGKLERIVSLSSFQLRGTGWYSTDYVKGPGIPPQAESQNNPALTENGNKGAETAASEDSSPKSEDKSADV